MPLPTGLVVKKRLEDAALGLRIHAWPVILDFHLHPRTIVFDPQDKSGFGSRLLRLRHGLGTVFQDVHEYLLNLARLARHHPNRIIVVPHYLDLLEVVSFLHIVIGVQQLNGLVEQVAKIIRIARELGIEPATPAEARQILNLKGLDKVRF